MNLVLDVCVHVQLCWQLACCPSSQWMIQHASQKLNVPYPHITISVQMTEPCECSDRQIRAVAEETFLLLDSETSHLVSQSSSDSLMEEVSMELENDLITATLSFGIYWVCIHNACLTWYHCAPIRVCARSTKLGFSANAQQGFMLVKMSKHMTYDSKYVPADTKTCTSRGHTWNQRKKEEKHETTPWIELPQLVK